MQEYGWTQQILTWIQRWFYSGLQPEHIPPAILGGFGSGGVFSTFDFPTTVDIHIAYNGLFQGRMYVQRCLL
jgi:hypothetical protein